MIMTTHLQPSPVSIDFRLVNSSEIGVSEFKDHPFELTLESSNACLVAYLTEDELCHLLGKVIKIRGEFLKKELGTL